MISPPPTLIKPFKAETWQIAPWRDKSLTVLLTGSAGGGKSRLAAEKLHGYCLKYPGSTAVMLRKTAESCTNSIVAFMQNVVIGSDPAVWLHTSARRFEYANGSVLVWGGMKDQAQREQIRSIGQDSGIDILWMEEATAFVEDDYNELLARMRGKAGSFRQIILTTNPGAPSHWIHERLIKGGEAHVYYSSALDNPYNPPEYLAILQQLKGLLYQRLVLGKWVQAEGAVFEEFDPAVHIIDTLPASFKRYVVGVDWGYTNPGVMLVFGVDGDGRLYLVEEVYRTRELVAGVDGKDGFWIKEARRIKNRYKNPRFWCDPSEPAYIETLQRAGILAEKADNDIRSGIDKIKTRLNRAWDGKPRLFFWRYANRNPDPTLEKPVRLPTGILDEITAYVYAKGSDGKPNKETPIDNFNHAVDSCRYVCSAEDAPQGVYVRQL
jgi:PBSX family phage terminase large subunit